MNGGKSPGDLIAALAAGFFGGLVILMLSHANGLVGPWCSAEEKDCLREWIGASSGWAAAFAAAATIVYLSVQAREARRQTDFVIGDADPTLEMAPDENDFKLATFTVTNWNRRSISVDNCRVMLGGCQKPEIWFFEEVNGRLLHTHVAGFPFRRLDGWIDRSKPPTQARWAVRPDLQQNVEIYVSVTVIGESHRRIELTARSSDFFKWHSDRYA